MRRIPRQVVGAVSEDGFSGEHRGEFPPRWDIMLNQGQEIMMFLQALPTKDWTEKDIELLLSEAFIWQSLFQDSRAHLRPAGDRSPENGFQ